ncbi:MAG: hypothetical protein SPM09_03550 [Fibrobacter sp.]|uniref:hypothetical protein n=1 Tax=Fibrobacter sp. TaxID=35828 RepID=UPI002A909A6A|nr:hypothetical protein [Fibrobacter sp.]MDY6263464.1 hypothetical protein [Fibrobacter sp.]
MDSGHSASRMTKEGIDSEDPHDSIASLQNDGEKDLQNENGNNLQDDSGDDRLG